MAEVKMLKSTYWGDNSHPSRTMHRGEIYTVPEDIADRWISRRIAALHVKDGAILADSPRATVGRSVRVPGVSELMKS
jgi:hypothetical protein